MQIEPYRCACGSTDIAAVKPGEEPEYMPDDLFARLPLYAGRPDVATCWACYTREGTQWKAI